jgi:hypothetical protein
MPGNKRVLIDESSSDEEILYVLGKKTRKNMRMFLEAFKNPLCHVFDGYDPDDSTEAENFLVKELCAEPGELDVDKVEELLLDENYHLPVMEALECLLGYDIDMRDVEAHLQSDEEVEDVRRIVARLPKWGGIAREKRAAFAKKAKSE